MFDDNKGAKLYANRLDVWSKRSSKVLEISKKEVNTDEEIKYRKKAIKIFINLLKLIKLDVYNLRREVKNGKL